MEFLKELLYGSKLMLKKDAVCMVDVPKWEEFKVKDFYNKVYHLEKFKVYLPEL